MSRHECGSCRAHLHTSGGHSECVICSGVKWLSSRAWVIPCWHRSRVLHSSHSNMIHRYTSVRISAPRLQRTVWSLSVDLRRKLPLWTPCHWQLQMGMLHRGSRLPFVQRVQCRQRTGSHLHEGRGGTRNWIVISRRACPQPPGQMVPARTLPVNPPPKTVTIPSLTSQSPPRHYLALPAHFLWHFLPNRSRSCFKSLESSIIPTACSISCPASAQNRAWAPTAPSKSNPPPTHTHTKLRFTQNRTSCPDLKAEKKKSGLSPAKVRLAHAGTLTDNSVASG